MSLRLILSCLLCLTLFGCAFQQHMSRGDDLYARGDYRGAITAYEAAIKVDPASKDAKARLADARKRLSLETVKTARAALRSGDLEAALTASLEALSTLPQDNAVQQLAVDVAGAHTARAAEHERRGEFADALALLGAVYDAYPLQRPRLEPALARVTDTWTQKLALNAAEAEKGGHLGDSLLLYAQASELKRVPEYVAKRDELRAKLLDQHTYRLALKGPRTKEHKFVVSVLDAPSDLAYQLLPKGKAPATLTLDVGTPGCSTRTSSNQRTKRYQSGTKLVPNPFYESKRGEVERAEKDVLRRQQDVNRYEKDYNSASQRVQQEGDTPGTSTGAEQALSRATSSLERARDNLLRDQQTLQRKREELARTDQNKEEPVYADLRYTVQTHTRRCVAPLKIRVDHADGRELLELKTGIVASHSDTTHGDHPVAGIMADPLDLQSAASLKSSALRGAASQTRQLISKSLQGHRKKMLDAAGAATTESARIHHYVLYILLDPGLVAPEVIDDIAGARGIPNPVEVLTGAR